MLFVLRLNTFVLILAHCLCNPMAAEAGETTAQPAPSAGTSETPDSLTMPVSPSTASPATPVDETDEIAPSPEQVAPTTETSSDNAQTNATTNPAELTTHEALTEDADEAEPGPFFRFLDEHQQQIASGLHQFVQGADNFFANSDSIDENTGSYLRVSLESIWPEGQGMDFKGGLGLKLRLPKTQRKLKLVIESDVDEKRDSLDLATREATTVDNKNEQSYAAGIEGEVGRSENWRFRPSIGLRIRSPLDPYVKFRAERHDYFDKWALLLNETLYWFDSSGFGSDSTMRWDRQLSDQMLLRLNSFIRYTDLKDYYEMSQTIGLIQTLSKKRAITYQAGVFGISEPTTHATTYLLNAVYRNNLHKDYLFLDIQPQIIYTRERDFHPQLELLMRLEIFYRD